MAFYSDSAYAAYKIALLTKTSSLLPTEFWTWAVMEGGVLRVLVWGYFLFKVTCKNKKTLLFDLRCYVALTVTLSRRVFGVNDTVLMRCVHAPAQQDTGEISTKQATVLQLGMGKVLWPDFTSVPKPWSLWLVWGLLLLALGEEQASGQTAFNKITSAQRNCLTEGQKTTNQPTKKKSVGEKEHWKRRLHRKFPCSKSAAFSKEKTDILNVEYVPPLGYSSAKSNWETSFGRKEASMLKLNSWQNPNSFTDSRSQFKESTKMRFYPCGFQ